MRGALFASGCYDGYKAECMFVDNGRGIDLYIVYIRYNVR